jgi:RNA polymerase sigma-70 factor (ECF subfamily)
VAEQALSFSQLALSIRPVLVNGAAGIVSWLPSGRPFSVMGFTVTRGKIVEIDVLADPARLRQLDLAVLDDRRSAPPGSRRAEKSKGENR